MGVRFGLDGIVDFLIYAFMGVGLVWGAARRTLRRLRPDDVTVTPSEVEARRGGRRTRRTARSELLWVEVVQESDSAYAQTRGGKSFWDTFLARDEKSWAVLGRTAAGEPVLLADSLDREVALAAAAALEDTLELLPAPALPVRARVSPTRAQEDDAAAIERAEATEPGEQRPREHEA